MTWDHDMKITDNAKVTVHVGPRPLSTTPTLDPHWPPYSREAMLLCKQGLGDMPLDYIKEKYTSPWSSEVSDHGFTEGFMSEMPSSYEAGRMLGHNMYIIVPILLVGLAIFFVARLIEKADKPKRKR